MKIGLQNLLLSTVAVLASLVLGGLCSSAFAAALPKSPTELATKSTAEMKPFSDVKWPLGKAVKTDDLKNKSETELSLMRNSIYAQAGFKFSEPWLKNYFSSRTWYKEGYNPKSLAQVDFENIKLIYDYQKTNHLLTLFTPTKDPLAMIAANPRKTASDADSVKMDTKTLMKLRYCNVMMDGSPFYRFTFHHDQVLTIQGFDDKGNPYSMSESSSEDADSSPYEDRSGDKSAKKSTWSIKGGTLFVSIHGSSKQPLVLTNQGITKHECSF